MLSMGILVFDDVELLDIAAPQAVFAGTVQPSAPGTQPESFRCFLVASEMRPIRSRGGIKLLPDCVLPPAGDLDLLLVAGGILPALGEDSGLLDWLAAHAGATRAIAGIGMGAMLLERAGLLAPRLSSLQLMDRTRTDCDKVLTSPGGAAALGLCLQLLARLAGRPLAQARARQLGYQWEADGTACRPAAAGVFLAA